MTIREQLEARELEFLAAQASKSGESRGRLRPEPEDPIRPVFQRDRDISADRVNAEVSQQRL